MAPISASIRSRLATAAKTSRNTEAAHPARTPVAPTKAAAADAIPSMIPSINARIALALRIGRPVRAQHMRIRTPDAARRPQRQNTYAYTIEMAIHKHIYIHTFIRIYTPKHVSCLPERRLLCLHDSLSCLARPPGLRCAEAGNVLQQILNLRVGPYKLMPPKFICLHNVCVLHQCVYSVCVCVPYRRLGVRGRIKGVRSRLHTGLRMSS